MARARARMAKKGPRSNRMWVGLGTLSAREATALKLMSPKSNVPEALRVEILDQYSMGKRARVVARALAHGRVRPPNKSKYARLVHLYSKSTSGLDFKRAKKTIMTGHVRKTESPSEQVSVNLSRKDLLR